ncbi:hypothetical protein FH972_004952 [Carpinus fangiana]|jgi:hypothetical protein|uniref:Uncharacterized protein n=1 Tax=Carpinus fangiana TaxID=176857 RepID=A0A5N6QPM2_9ROSI|nr:hypothetical protein FH972_004952 [Carpinus fangiana]
MSAVVETWMGQLAKLGEKVKARKPLFSKAKKGGEVEEAKEGVKESRVVQRDNNNTAMLSEATVCLLMDRFAPC